MPLHPMFLLSTIAQVPHMSRLVTKFSLSELNFRRFTTCLCGTSLITVEILQFVTKQLIWHVKMFIGTFNITFEIKVFAWLNSVGREGESIELIVVPPILTAVVVCGTYDSTVIEKNSYMNRRQQRFMEKCHIKRRYRLLLLTVS